MVCTMCDHQCNHGFVMDGNICMYSWLTSASVYRMLRSGTDLQGRAPPQWLAWLHRGWLTLIMWHARRSVLLGQAWTMTFGSRYVVTAQPRNHMHGLSSGRYNANWVRWTCSLETAAKWFLLCLTAAHDFISAASQHSSIQYVFLLWFPYTDNMASHKSKFNGLKDIL
jgi:hypothetical protein